MHFLGCIPTLAENFPAKSFHSRNGQPSKVFETKLHLPLFFLRLTKGPVHGASWLSLVAVHGGRGCTWLVAAGICEGIARRSPQTCIVPVPGRLFVARRSPPALHRSFPLYCCYGNDLLGKLTYPSFAYIPYVQIYFEISPESGVRILFMIDLGNEVDGWVCLQFILSFQSSNF